MTRNRLDPDPEDDEPTTDDLSGIGRTGTDDDDEDGGWATNDDPPVGLWDEPEAVTDEDDE